MAGPQQLSSAVAIALASEREGGLAAALPELDKTFPFKNVKCKETSVDGRVIVKEVPLVHFSTYYLALKINPGFSVRSLKHFFLISFQ